MAERSEARGRLVAAEALEWVGTPFVWQQARKGRGCDCKGLVAGVAGELGFPEADSLYATMADYSDRRPVPSATLIEGMGAVFEAVTLGAGDRALGAVPPGLMPGDVLLLVMTGKASHLAIVTEPGASGRAVHAQLGPKDWVKETSLRALLHNYPLHSAYRWKILAAAGDQSRLAAPRDARESLDG